MPTLVALRLHVCCLRAGPGEVVLMLILGLLFGLLALSPLLALALLALANSERARALPRRIGERLWARPPSTPHNMQAAQAQIARGVDDTARQAHERESATSLPATE